MDDMEAVLKQARQEMLEEDIELVEECKLGSRKAFNQLMLKYQNKVFSIAMRMLKNTDEAQDAAQDVFLAVYRSIKKFRGDSKLKTWIYRIVINTCINRLKSKKRKQQAPLDNQNEMLIEKSQEEGKTPQATIDNPLKALERKNLREIIEKEIAKLPEENRVIIIMRDVEGLSYEQIEKILEIPDGTVKSRLHRGRQELKKRLKKYL